MAIVLVIALAALSNVIVLCAVWAGRKKAGSSQMLLLLCEVSLLAVTVILALFLAMNSGSRDMYEDALLAIFAIVLGLLAGGLLTYFEYRLTGHANQFGYDIRRSLWVGRYGMKRLDDPGN